MAIEQSFFDELEKVDIIYYDETRAYFNKNRLDQYIGKAKKYDLIKELWDSDVDGDMGLDELGKVLDNINSIINGGVGTQ